MVNHQLGWLERVDERGIASELFHGVAHGGKVYNRGDSGEILREHAAGSEGDFFFRPCVFVPGGESANVVGLDVLAVFGAQQVFQENAKGIGQVLGGNAVLVERIEAVDFVFFVVDFQTGAAVEAVHE